MKVAFVVFIVAIFGCDSARSQPRWSPQVRAQREAEWMRDSLLVDTTLQKKMLPVLLNYQQQMDAIAKRSDAPTRRTEISRIKDRKLKSLLSHQQYLKYIKHEHLEISLPRNDNDHMRL